MTSEKGHGTETVRLDEGEEEESEVMQEAQTGMGGGARKGTGWRDARARD